MSTKHNVRSSAVKRILQEHRELLRDPSEDFVAAPLENDIFEWHVTMKGTAGTDYEGGIYHVRITLPPTYPLSPPDIAVLTPQGRFQPSHKLCIDGLTSFHSGSWMPAWGIRTAVVGLQSFWNQLGDAVVGVGYLQYSKEEKRRLARVSPDWKCEACQATNKEIMHAHEETLNEVIRDEKVDKGKEKETVAETFPAFAASPEPRVEAAREDAVAIASLPANSLSAAEAAASPPPPRHGSHHSGLDHGGNRPTVAGSEVPHTLLTVGPRPSTFLHTLLRPPPSYLAPLRIFHYYALYLLLPLHMQESYLPPPPDRVVFLDCAIGLVAFWLVVMCMDKFAGEWVEKHVMGLIGVGGVAGVAVGAAAGGGHAAAPAAALPAAVTGHGRPEHERPGQLGLQVDGATLGVAGPAAVPVGDNGREGELRRHHVAGV